MCQPQHYPMQIMAKHRTDASGETPNERIHKKLNRLLLCAAPQSPLWESFLLWFFHSQASTYPETARQSGRASGTDDMIWLTQNADGVSPVDGTFVAHSASTQYKSTLRILFLLFARRRIFKWHSKGTTKHFSSTAFFLFYSCVSICGFAHILCVGKQLGNRLWRKCNKTHSHSKPFPFNILILVRHTCRHICPWMNRNRK